MTKANKKTSKEDEIQNICRNRRAFHEYHLSDTMECGIVLTGTEVKSLRERVANLEDAYARVNDGELWLYGCDIPEYSMANRMNHKPKRPRKLLLHKREIGKFVGKAAQRGFTIIPLRLYFKRGWAKIEIAIAKGKQLHDKREDQKKKDAEREIKGAMGKRR